MCLSDCNSCKYLDRYPNHSGDILCGLNPAYASAFKRLQSLDEYSKSCLPIDDCRDFELDPAFEEIAIALNLSFDDWQQLARESSNPRLIQTLRQTAFELNLSLTLNEWQQLANSTSIPNLRVTLESHNIEAQRDPWICFDSSCIDAIAFFRHESILKIRFVSGSVYQYERVEEHTFFDFCDAESKGVFFNQHIKDLYRYQLI